MSRNMAYDCGFLVQRDHEYTYIYTYIRVYINVYTYTYIYIVPFSFTNKHFIYYWTPDAPVHMVTMNGRVYNDGAKLRTK